MDLIVARYTEDLSWLRRVPRTVRVYVYDKSGVDGDLPGRVTCERLPNVGREAHTYLRHIVAQYDQLSDVNVFVQGRPFDHAPDLHKVLRELASGAARVDAFRWLGFLVDRDDRTGSLLFQRWSKNPDCRPLPMENFWRRVFDDESCPEHFTFFGGAQFAVTREAIRARTRSWYARALESSTDSEETAHCFERVWDRVFGVDGIPPDLRDRAMPVYLKPIRRLIVDAHRPNPV